MTEPTEQGRGGGYLDDPNREAVGVDPVWVEGTGGTAGEPNPTAEAREEEPEPEGDAPEPEPEPEEEPEPEPMAGPDLDAMTKDELLAHAQGLGVKPANATMSKAELRAGIEAHGR